MIFAAGMSLLDTIDGSFMNFAYGWAFSKPVRKVYYNITVTGLSVAVALIIGTVELLSLLAQQLGWSGGVWDWIGGLDLNALGLLHRRHVRGDLDRGAAGVAVRPYRGEVERRARGLRPAHFRRRTIPASVRVSADTAVGGREERSSPAISAAWTAATAARRTAPAERSR